MKHFPEYFLTKSIFFTLIFVSTTALFTQAQQNIFSRTLTLGSSGEDVRELQKILNSSPDTIIRSEGPGSPGQETTYFGALTRHAVVRFQEKYRSEILVPNGLSAGTGFVGPSTRSALNRLALNVSGVPLGITSLSESLVLPPAETVSENPNEDNLDLFLAAIDSVAAQQGVSAETLAPIKEQIRKDIATTTNLRDTFIDTAEKYTSKAPDPMRGPLTSLLNIIKTAVSPKRAQAIDTGFGGELYYSFFCACSGTWLVNIQPLPPTHVTLLNYIIGTQIHLSYNIPFTTNVFGKYTKGAGQCSVYIGSGCGTIPSQGLMTPTVGSSAR